MSLHDPKKHRTGDGMSYRMAEAAPKQASGELASAGILAEATPGTAPGGAVAALPMSALKEADRVLLAAAQAGDADAFFELVHPHQRMLFVSAVSVVRNDADAEEVVQEAMLKALRYLGGFRGECKFSTWLVQIVVNEARMRLRKERRHLYEPLDEGPATDEGDYIPREWADWREIPSESLERKELRDALRAACDALPPKYREVFMLRDVQQLNIAETAEILKITPGCVRTRLLRARLMMRDMLAQFRRD